MAEYEYDLCPHCKKSNFIEFRSHDTKGITPYCDGCGKERDSNYHPIENPKVIG